MEKIDTWRTAKLILELFGDGAPDFAARKAMEGRRAGDRSGASLWSDILAAIANMHAVGRPPGVTVH